MHPSKIPPGRKPTYLRIISAFRPRKADPYRIRWTVRGNIIDYPGVVYTPTADLTTVKILLNSIISTTNACFCNIDLKDFYLATGGHIPSGITPGLFKHRTNPISFCLVVNDFGVKYVHWQDSHNLISHLQKDYKIVTNWDVDLFYSIRLQENYEKRTVELNIPGYVTYNLVCFKHSTPHTPQDSSHPYTAPIFGTKTKYVAPLARTPLTPKQTQWVQEFVDIFLFYARAIDNTMIASIGSIASSHSTSTWDEIY